MWQLEIDKGACLGTGMCAGTAPEYFEVMQGKSQLLRAEIEPDSKATDAAEMCPVEAIRVKLAATGEVLAPL